MRPIFLIAVCLLAVGATAHAQSPADLIRGQNEEFARAFNAGEADHVSALYTEDAMILPPGEPVIEGREDITGFWQAGIEAGFTDLELMSIEIVATGDTAYETGTLSLSAPGEDGSLQPVAAKYVVVWQKQGDGTWRLHRDIWNLSPPE